jgi:purine-nucleoside phosphorylase
MTPHIEAKKGDFAPFVIMPGDPLRAKFIAENFLENARLINKVRGMLAYTGAYKGKAVSVMASGMGMPSMGIYSYELFKFYDVQSIIRTGTAGAVADGVNVRDIVIALACSTNSGYAAQYDLPGTIAPCPSFPLLEKGVSAARRMGIEPKVGNILTSDVFYDNGEALAVWRKMGILAIEMEAAALYLNAAKFAKNALCICTVSDHCFTGEALSARERETSFVQMIEIALECAD